MTSLAVCLTRSVWVSRSDVWVVAAVNKMLSLKMSLFQNSQWGIQTFLAVGVGMRWEVFEATCCPVSVMSLQCALCADSGNQYLGSECSIFWLARRCFVAWVWFSTVVGLDIANSLWRPGWNLRWFQMIWEYRHGWASCDKGAVQTDSSGWATAQASKIGIGKSISACSCVQTSCGICGLRFLGGQYVAYIHFMNSGTCAIMVEGDCCAEFRGKVEIHEWCAPVLRLNGIEKCKCFFWSGVRTWFPVHGIVSNFDEREVTFSLTDFARCSNYLSDLKYRRNSWRQQHQVTISRSKIAQFLSDVKRGTWDVTVTAHA